MRGGTKLNIFLDVPRPRPIGVHFLDYFERGLIVANLACHVVKSSNTHFTRILVSSGRVLSDTRRLKPHLAKYGLRFFTILIT